MKTKKLSFAVIAMAIVAITVAVVSCNKEAETVLHQKDNVGKEAFDMRELGDVNAYLNVFRQRLMDCKSDENMPIDEAAWHLACLANLDLCNASVEFNDVRFDTIEMQVTVNNGVMEMNDLRTAYEQMISEIQSFEGSLNLDNQNLRFVNVFLSDNGKAEIGLMTTFHVCSRDLDEHHYYFPNTFGYLDSICYDQFPNIQYLWNTEAKSELERVMNVFEGRIYVGGTTCYVPTRSVSFDYPLLDSYGSPFLNNSRLCAYGFNKAKLMQDEMCYCIDSYLGLGCDYLNNNPYVNNERPILWAITPIDSLFSGQILHTYYHRLVVQYGQPTNGTLDPNQ